MDLVQNIFKMERSIQEILNKIIDRVKGHIIILTETYILANGTKIYVMEKA